jgi:SAM-dependent methyltransferase
VNSYTYTGTELNLFAAARNWKTYVREQLRAYLKGDVLEVGAGLGATSDILCDGTQNRWVCLEPDADLANQISPSAGGFVRSVIIGSMADLSAEERYDCILYMDVLEHIEDDKAELQTASLHLNPGGTLVVLCPAHQYLFTPFDAQIGHYRRYNAASLGAAGPASLKLETTFYLDSVGFFASLANKLVLQAKMPGKAQIRFWDSCLVPLSRIMDGVLFHRFGKSVVAVWRNIAAAGCGGPAAA